MAQRRITRDRSSMINKYLQTHYLWADEPFGGGTIGTYGCSLTCAAMCVKQSPRQFVNDKLNGADGLNWSAVATKYGYKFKQETMAVNLDNLLRLLKTNPVILGVKYPASPIGTHFVVVYKFDGTIEVDASGEPLSGMTKDMFYVYDPIAGGIKLSDSRITGFISMRRYYK